jgi:hypothetical protein
MTAMRTHPSPTSPTTHLWAIGAGDDANDLAYMTKGLEVQTAGNIKITTQGGETLTKFFWVGYHSIHVTRVWATDMTAAGVYGHA